jgi:Acetyltransferases
VIDYRKIKETDCTPVLLTSFSRYQEVRRCWRQGVLKDISYIEQWDSEKKRAIVQKIHTCIAQGGSVIGAFDEQVLIGFAMVEPPLFGYKKEYINLSMLHVSHEYRGKGIGHALFEHACSAAMKLSARKLYISVHSAEETIAFYKSVGCVNAVEVNARLAQEEPCDCQMEYSLR